MKILQVVPFFSPVHGGSATVPYYLSKELAKRGHEVTLFTSDCQLSEEWVKSLDRVEVRAFKTWSSWSKFYVTPGMSKATHEKIRHFDIIHMHNFRSFQNIVIWSRAKKYGVPYLLQAHGSLPNIAAKQILKGVYDVFFGHGLLRNAARVIALNHAEAEQFRAIGVPDDKIVIVPNGLDLSEYTNLPIESSFRKKFGIEPDDKIVLYLGRLHEIKGIDILVNAFAEAIKKLDNVRLVIAGPDDGYLYAVKTLIKGLNIENYVLITGPLYGKNKMEAYMDADVYVLPSRYETFPMGLLEAYAFKKPVICSKVFGLEELVIDGTTGYLFELGNTNQLKSSLIRLLKDDTRNREMGAKGREFLEKNFTLQSVIDRLEELYEEVVSKHSFEDHESA